MSTKIQITALDHFQMAMPDGREDDARRFYGDLMGLREVPKPIPLAARGGVWFQGPEIALHLGIEKDFQPARKSHPCFRVVNLEETRKALQLAGIEVIPDESLPGVRQFYAADPFGNRIEFLQEGDRLE